MKRLLPAALVWILTLGTAAADEVRVAVAANFRDTLQVIADEFETATGHRVVVSPGSTGRIYAQILNGAPYDLFLAADAQRPAALAETGRAPPDSRFDYAIGRLVVWSREPLPAGDPEAWLITLDSLAVANPRLAPYGLAGHETLETLGIGADGAGPRIVTGENVSQTFQFAGSGNVSAGLVALAQMRLPAAATGHYQIISGELHSPILQQGVLLTDNAGARQLRDFLLSDPARAIIESHGYELPQRDNE